MMRMTKQKCAVLEALEYMHDHPTADDIYLEVKKKFPNISLGTVYRNLNNFVAEGKIAKVEIPNTGDRFDYRLEKHNHFICLNCKKIFDINASIELEDSSLEVDHYKLVVYGKCSDCNK